MPGMKTVYKVKAMANKVSSSSPPARNNRIVHFFFALAHTSHLAKSGESKRYEPETQIRWFSTL